MKKTRWFSYFAIVILMLFCNFNFVYATNDDFCATKQNEERAISLWQSLNIKQENIKNKPVISFDVNEEKEIVIATDDESIIVLDEYGNKISGFTFDVQGLYFVKWSEKNVLLFLERESAIIEMDIEGNLISAFDVDRDDFNTAQRWRELRKETTVTIKSINYSMKSDNVLFSVITSSYSVILSVDAEENQTIVYEASQSFYISALSRLFIIMIIILIFVIQVIRISRKYKNTRGRLENTEGRLA